MPIPPASSYISGPLQPHLLYFMLRNVKCVKHHVTELAGTVCTRSILNCLQVKPVWGRAEAGQQHSST